MKKIIASLALSATFAIPSIAFAVDRHTAPCAVLLVEQELPSGVVCTGNKNDIKEFGWNEVNSGFGVIVNISALSDANRSFIYVKGADILVCLRVESITSDLTCWLQDTTLLDDVKQQDE